jgi:nucleoside-diphosphate-sugar epimerase
MILVTGGTGLLGSHLLFRLLEEYEVVKATYRTEASMEEVRYLFEHYSDNASSLFARIQWVKADITDVPAMETAFEGVTRVYHSAAMISFNPAAWEALKKTNIEGTANIVNLCLAHKVDKLCYVSSIAAVGKGSAQSEVTEENQWDEAESSVYALSKHLAEMEVWRGSQEGLDVVIVNPGVIIGPGNWTQGSLRFFKNAAGGMKSFFPGGTGFVDVKDVATCMQLLMESEIRNERFITVSKNMSYEDFLGSVSETFGLPRPRRRIPMWMLELGWRLDWFSHYFLRNRRRLTRDIVSSLKSPRQYSSRKIEDTLGFQFTDIGKSIRFCCAFFLKRYPSAFSLAH